MTSHGESGPVRRLHREAEPGGPRLQRSRYVLIRGRLRRGNTRTVQPDFATIHERSILITVHLSGGLGNQLFQYAAGLGLAARRATSLSLETRKFRKGGGDPDDPAARPLRIMDFQLPHRRICTAAEENAWRRRWNFARTLHLPPRWFGFLTEDTRRYDPSFADAPGGVCLRGYFQSERYFQNVADEVRAAFRPADASLMPRTDAQLAPFRRPGRELVAVHIRRGDFLTLTDRDCLTGEDFLDAAMSAFPGAYFLVFSDDPDWCRARFASRADVGVSPFTRVIEDFVAMSRCDHNILAKSTFSWWSAWLNETPGRRVIAPYIAPEPTWGGGGADYYPPGWTIL